MKIGLIAPFRNKVDTYYSNNTLLRQFFTENTHVPGFFHPNLALLTIAALTPDDIEVRLIDERVDELDFEEKLDIVGITSMTAQALRAYEIADQFRKRGVHVVLGGIHVTVLPEEAKAHCDTLIIGEAENTWPQFIEDFKRQAPRSMYKDHSVDFSNSPTPRYDLVDRSVFHILPLQTTRGCPHSCSFCSVTKVFGPRYRVKGVDQVVKEIETIQHISGSRRVVFNDDNTFVNRTKAYEILAAITPLRVRYFAQTDISIADDRKLLQLLRESGCKTVFIGFESLIPENLHTIQKSGWKLKRLEEYSNSIDLIQSYGIQVLGSFVVGFDHDTEENLSFLRNFVLDNNIWAQFLFLTPFPGTRVREELISSGRISADHANWDMYTCFDAVFEPKGLSADALEKTMLEIYESVYSDAADKKRIRHMVNKMKSAAGKSNHHQPEDKAAGRRWFVPRAFALRAG